MFPSQIWWNWKAKFSQSKYWLQEISLQSCLIRLWLGSVCGNTAKDVCSCLHQAIIEEVWLSPQELPAAQWELHYHWTKHLTSSSGFLSLNLSVCLVSLCPLLPSPLFSPSSAGENICCLAGRMPCVPQPGRAAPKRQLESLFFPATTGELSFPASFRGAVLHLSATPPLTSVSEDSGEQLSQFPCALKHANEFVFCKCSQKAQSTFSMQRSSPLT